MTQKKENSLRTAGANANIGCKVNHRMTMLCPLPQTNSQPPQERCIPGRDSKGHAERSSALPNRRFEDVSGRLGPQNFLEEDVPPRIPGR